MRIEDKKENDSKSSSEEIKDDNNIIHKEKINVAITSIIASLALTVSKIIIALLTNSLGILSEGMHSGLDVLAATMTLYAIRMAGKPPDPEHHYGYAKFESLTSLGEVILLLATAAWIMYEGLERLLFFVHTGPEITIFSFGVMISSIIVDFGRSRALYKTANKYGSQALEADALHFRMDMLTSSIVLVGLTVVYLFGIRNADTIAAMTVSILIVYTSLGLGRRTLDVLLDKAPKGIQARIMESITGFEGIKNVHRIRVRKVGKDTFVDLHIEVPRTFSHDKAHRIATNVENKIKYDVLSNSAADVIVHVDAVKDVATETIRDKVRLIAADFPLIKNVHSIYLSWMAITDTIIDTDNTTDLRDRGEKQDQQTPQEKESRYPPLHLYLDIQMDNSLGLKEAHSIIDDFEKKVKEEIPSVQCITTHIETELDIESNIGHEEIADQSYLEKIKKIALSVNGVTECRDIALMYVGTDLHITMTIKLNLNYSDKRIKKEPRNIGYFNDDYNKRRNNDGSSISIEKAHEITTIVQNLVIENTGAKRVIVHAEPASI